MATINRAEFPTTEAYAFHIFNNLGCSDIEFAHADQDRRWSKWYSYKELMTKDPEDFIQYNSARKIMVKDFWAIVNNRTVLDIEIMLDIDEGEDGSPDPASIQDKAEKIIQKLKENGIMFEAFFSGSKSYHISILIPQFRTFPLWKKREYKGKILTLVGADKLKSSERCMIAMSGVPHWKTGIIKEKINEYNRST